MIERLTPPGVPAPRGPYSPAVRAGDFIFVSGQVSADAVTVGRHVYRRCESYPEPEDPCSVSVYTDGKYVHLHYQPERLQQIVASTS